MTDKEFIIVDPNHYLDEVENILSTDRTLYLENFLLEYDEHYISKMNWHIDEDGLSARLKWHSETYGKNLELIIEPEWKYRNGVVFFTEYKSLLCINDNAVAEYDVKDIRFVFRKIKHLLEMVQDSNDFFENLGRHVQTPDVL